MGEWRDAFTVGWTLFAYGLLTTIACIKDHRDTEVPGIALGLGIALLATLYAIWFGYSLH